MFSSFTGSTLLAALFGAMTISTGVPDGTAPIRLVSEPTGSGLRLKVIGSSDRIISADYTLEVSSRSNGGTNRSSQSGGVRLEPGVVATLVTLSLGNVRDGAWTARLQVHTSEGVTYEEVISSTSRGATDVPGRSVIGKGADEVLHS